MKYTEKTNGAQIKALLTTLFPKTHFIGNDFSYPHPEICVAKVEEGFGLEDLLSALQVAKIDQRFVTITTDTLGHLNIVICNYDGSDIEIGDE